MDIKKLQKMTPNELTKYLQKIFKDKTDFNINMGGFYISYTSGTERFPAMLSKVVLDKHYLSVDGRWILV